MIKIIIGLGNPGKKYEKTRHNVGFAVVENLLERSEEGHWSNDERFSAQVTKTNITGKQVILAKPQTFMNDSGESVSKLLNYFKLKPEEAIVVADDINLEIGVLRVRKGGSEGGHKGLASIIEKIGEDFYRLRVGVGFNEKEPAEKYVLKQITADEQQEIDKAIDKAVDNLVECVTSNPKIETIK